MGLEFAPIMHDETADELVEQLGLADESSYAPHVSFDDIPRFSYLENSNTFEADENLDKEIAAKVAKMSEFHSFLQVNEAEHDEADNEADNEVDNEIDNEADNEGMDEGDFPENDYPENGNYPPEFVNAPVDVLKVPVAMDVRHSKAGIVPFAAFNPVILPTVPLTATVVPVMIPAAAPVGKKRNLSAACRFTPAKAKAVITFTLKGARDALLADPAMFQRNLVSDIAAVTSANTNRFKILNIDPHSMIVHVLVKQAFLADLKKGNDNVDINAHTIARKFYNYHAEKKYGDKKVLGLLDPFKVVSYKIKSAQEPILTGLPIRMKLSTDVRAVSTNTEKFLKSLRSDISKIAGVQESQVHFTTVVPFAENSLHDVVVNARLTLRPDTLADDQVNPMTAIANLNKAIRNKKSALYSTATLKGIDTTLPLQENLNNRPLRQYKTWAENPDFYSDAVMYADKPVFNHQPIIIPTMTVGAPINQTASAPPPFAIQL